MCVCVHRRQLDFTSGGSHKLSPGWVGGHGNLEHATLEKIWVFTCPEVNSGGGRGGIGERWKSRAISEFLPLEKDEALQCHFLSWIRM